jgi:hypothetical protein
MFQSGVSRTGLMAELIISEVSSPGLFWKNFAGAERLAFLVWRIDDEKPTYRSLFVLDECVRDLAQVEEQLGRLTAAEAFYRAIGLLTRGFLG